eukprot:6879406-Prymnesium_polylepis.1
MSRACASAAVAPRRAWARVSGSTFARGAALPRAVWALRRGAGARKAFCSRNFSSSGSCERKRMSLAKK